MNTDALNFVAACHATDMIAESHYSDADKDAMIRDLADSGPAIRPVTMCLIYPGMTSFVEVEIIEPASDPGYVMTRPVGSNDEPMKTAVSRLVDRETAITRSSTRVIERHTDWVDYTITEHTVRAI